MLYYVVIVYYRVPTTGVVFFRDEGDEVPALEFLKDCATRDKRIVAKFETRIKRLEELGWELTRPEADTLRDGVHELRVKFSGVNYRLLYGFYREGNAMAILAHGCTKEDIVPPKDIDIAKKRLERFKADPAKHTHVVVSGGNDEDNPADPAGSEVDQ